MTKEEKKKEPVKKLFQFIVIIIILVALYIALPVKWKIIIGLILTLPIVTIIFLFKTLKKYFASKKE